ncbi:oligosaccharide flippase family protein, partial [Patescibacteria group bacterium]
MKKKFKDLLMRLVRNQLVKGSAVLFLGGLVANLGNYFYHLLMGRMLGPDDYGALGSVISLVYFIGIPLTGINLVVVKRSAVFLGNNQPEKAAFLHDYLSGKLFWFGIVGAGLLVVIAPILKNFLHLNSVWPIIAIIGYSFLGIFTGIKMSVLRAFLKFWSMSVVSVLATIGKLGAAFLLVKWGCRVLGASGAFLVGEGMGLAVVNFSLKKALPRKGRERNQLKLGKIVKESVPFLATTFAFTSLYTTDLLLARHYLPTREMGYYAALSLLGKIIFFACGPISQVMFPMVSARYAAQGSYRNLFFLSLIMVLAVCFGVSLVYFFFPELMVKLLFGEKYLDAAKYLVVFAFFLSFYSLANLIANFFLSVSRNKVVFLPFIAALLQV